MSIGSRVQKLERKMLPKEMPVLHQPTDGMSYEELRLLYRENMRIDESWEGPSEPCSVVNVPEMTCKELKRIYIENMRLP